MTAAATDRPVQLSRLALALAFSAFVWGLVRLGAQAVLAFSYPYGLDYGEGVIWQQLIRIVGGTGYAPLAGLPAFTFQYPPLYHLVTAATAAGIGIDQLYAGRLVSLAATLVSAALIALLTAAAIGDAHDRRVRAAAGAFAGALFASMPTFLTSALLMQIDMLAMALTLAGMLLAVRAVAHPRTAIWAGIVFALALYTRQTSVSAPAGAFFVLLAVRPRTAWTMTASAVAVGVAILGLLQLAGYGDFLRQILLYNMNRIAWDHAAKTVFVLTANVVPIALGGIGVAVALQRLGLGLGLGLRLGLGDRATLRRRLAAESGLAATAIVLLTLAIKTLMLPMILKSGANDNYLIDWFAGIAIMAGIAVVPLIQAALRRPAAAPGIVLLALVGIGLPIHMSAPSLLPDYAQAAQERRAQDGLAARVRASKRPVVSDDMVLLLRAGQQVIWEPAIIAELGSSGVYDERTLAGRVRRGEFGFFATHGDRGELIYDQRFTPPIADAIDAAYPRRERVGALTLHLPER